MNIVNDFEISISDSSYEDKHWVTCTGNTFLVYVLVDKEEDAKEVARKFLKDAELVSISRCSDLLKGIVTTMAESSEDLLFIEEDDMTKEESNLLRNELEILFTEGSEIFSAITFEEDGARVSVHSDFLSYFNLIETELVLVYKDTINHSYNGDDNLCMLEVKKSFAEDYYHENLSEDYDSYEDWVENGICDLLLDFYDKANKANVIFSLSDY